MRAALASTNPAWRAPCLAALALGACLLPAAPALASTQPTHPEYFLSVVEGVTTRPEEPILSTSASVRHAHGLALSITRGGLEVALDSGNENTWLSQVPQVGDQVTVKDQNGQVVGAIVYDGLPSIDPTVCAGATNFSGQRSEPYTVEGGYYSYGSHTDNYGHTNWFRTGSGQAQVTALTGPAFAGNFLVPLAIGQTVWAGESLTTTLASGATFTYSSETDRPVGACPLPPVPIAAPAPPALQGTLLRLVRTTIHKLLTSGWTNHVTINQPGKVIQDLYLQGGTLPAFASSAKSKKHKRKPAALLLARGSVTTAVASVVSVHIRLTSRGRTRLKHANKVKAVLVTTLVSRSGAKLSLGRRTVSLHR